MTTLGESNHEVSSVEETLAKQNKRLDSAINYFKQLDSTMNLRNNVKLHLTVDEIVKHSMNKGLEPHQIVDLVDVISSSKHKLSQTIRGKFVKCLIPSTKVPQVAIVNVLSLISSKVFISSGPTNLHCLLLRWVLLVFDYIDGYNELHKLYNVVFSMINSSRLLPHACHLLFLLTTKNDVKLFRVQKLMEMVKTLGPEPYLLGLLMMYKMYCPYLVSMKLNISNKVFFRAQDSVWRSTIVDIVKLRQEEEDDLQTKQTAAEILSRKEKIRIQQHSKRQKLMFPEIHSAAHEVDEDADVGTQNLLHPDDKIPYTQIESFTSLLESIDKIEFPSQAAACLPDKKLQLILMCNPDKLVITRLCFWIQHIFAFGFKTTDKGSEDRNVKLLETLFTFSKNVQGLPVVFEFLESFLQTWDGQSYAPYIFSLITCVKPSSYNELYGSILEPLHKLFFSIDVYSKIMFISALRKLMWNLALEEKCNTLKSNSNGEQTQSRSSDSADITENQSRRSSQESGNEESMMGIIYHLINFLDSLVVLGMRMEDDHYLLQTAALDFLTLVSELYTKYTIPLISLPIQIIHRLMLSDSCTTLARLCGIMNTFREAIVALRLNKTKHRRQSLTYATTDTFLNKTETSGRESFNGLLLDVMGMLWQGNMFAGKKHNYESFFGIQPDPNLKGILRDKSLTIYTGPAFLGLAYKFLKETQREGKHMHPAQIEEFKEIYLQFLVRENFPEFMKFVNTNMKSRKNRPS